MRKFAKLYNCDMVLVEAKTYEPMLSGRKYKTFDGDEVLLVDGTPPHKPSSSGFVHIVHKVPQGIEFTNMDIREYYAGVIGAKWVLPEEVVVNI